MVVFGTVLAIIGAVLTLGSWVLKVQWDKKNDQMMMILMLVNEGALRVFAAFTIMSLIIVGIGLWI